MPAASKKSFKKEMGFYGLVHPVFPFKTHSSVICLKSYVTHLTALWDRSFFCMSVFKVKSLSHKCRRLQRKQLRQLRTRKQRPVERRNKLECLLCNGSAEAAAASGLLT
jgi:membrane-anchored glycerophosphoryl diester phosphodiesterase (GDPDase)